MNRLYYLVTAMSVLIVNLAGCAGVHWREIHTDRCNTTRECYQIADARCAGAAHVYGITNPEGENEAALFGDRVTPAGALLGGILSDAVDAAFGRMLEVRYSCEEQRRAFRQQFSSYQPNVGVSNKQGFTRSSSVRA